MARLDMQLIAIHDATIQNNHAWIVSLCDDCPCQLRLLHGHADEITNTQIIHVATVKATWHCIHVYLNSYRRTSSALFVAILSISRKQNQWHDWTCNTPQCIMQQFKKNTIMHEFTLYLIVVVVTCVCCANTPTNEPMFSSRLRIVHMNICLNVYIFFVSIYIYIYIYVNRKRERNKEREKESERERQREQVKRTCRHPYIHT
jgi:hypothetical protein